MKPGPERRRTFRNPKVMGLVSWNTSHSVLGIRYHDDLKILGEHMSKTILHSATVSWTTLTRKIRAQARAASSMDLSLHQRIRCVPSFLPAKAWHTAEIPPGDCVRQINTAVSGYIWRGDIFRVPLSTLYKRREHGGWVLINIAAKCRAFLLYRLQTKGRKSKSLTAKWLEEWNLIHPSKNSTRQTEFQRSWNTSASYRRTQPVFLKCAITIVCINQ